MASTARDRRFTRLVRLSECRFRWGVPNTFVVVVGASVAVVLFVVLTIVLFGLLALCVKGVEKL